MSIAYISTRGKSETITSAEAIVKGLSEDKGLYVPVEFPKLDKKYSEMVDMDYQDMAIYVFSKFFSDFSYDEIKECVEKSYDQKFRSEDIVPLTKVGSTYFLELFHGKTLAFKDIALSILPYFLTKAAKKIGEKRKIVILVATSGDTGKAALEGFAEIENVEIIVFYPSTGVSEIQKMQMITQEGSNTHVVAIDGNFDDAQNGVKRIFSDEDFKDILSEKGFVLSSANSINIGRLIPQVTYYIYTYFNLLKNEEIKEGEMVNFVVPTGNFGDILAGYYAKKMGLPINKLICASNENNVLTDFINSGVYDINREFKVTNSPSMDILISSNLERLIFEITGRNQEKVKGFMEDLKNNKKYTITDKMIDKLGCFYGNFATEAEVLSTIANIYEESGYVIDTHTAVAYNVYEKYCAQTNDEVKTVILSTASPYKFTKSVVNSLDPQNDEKDEFKMIKKLSNISGVEIPKEIDDLNLRKIIHSDKCKSFEMKEMIEKILDF